MRAVSDSSVGNQDDRFSDLSLCPFGADPGAFICGQNLNDCENSTLVFRISDGFFADYRNMSSTTSSVTLSATATTTSSLVSSSTLATSTSALSLSNAISNATSEAVSNVRMTMTDTCNKKLITVSTGVGVPLLVLWLSFLAAFIWAFAQLRKQRQLNQVIHRLYPSTSTTPESVYNDTKYDSRVYLHSTRPSELSMRKSEVYEISATPRVF
jgi:hypothetical protein